MKLTNCVVVVALLLWPGILVRAQERLQLAQSRPPIPAVASVDADGRVILRMQVEVFAAKPTKGAPGSENPPVFEPSWTEHSLVLKEKDIVKVQNTSGKAIAFKDLRAHLPKETAALYTWSDKVDPLHLRIIKEGTLIFYLAAPSAPTGPTVGTSAVPRLVSIPPGPAPAATPVTGLETFLKKQGYRAVPLERSSGLLTVRVEIRGKKVLLCLDTGAAYTCLDRYRLRDLSLEWNDDVWCLLDDLEVGGFRTGKFTVAAYDMTAVNQGIRMQNGPSLDGLLGADVLRPLSAVIDHAGATLYLRKPEPTK